MTVRQPKDIIGAGIMHIKFVEDEKPCKVCHEPTRARVRKTPVHVHCIEDMGTHWWESETHDESKI